MREDLIRSRAGGQQVGLRRVVGEQGRTDVDKDKRHGDIEQRTEEGRFHCLARCLGRHVALHIVLIDTVVLHVGKQTIDQHHPEGRLDERCTKRAKRELPVLGGNLKELRGSLGHREGQKQGTRNRTQDQDDALNRIGPHHGRDTAHERVEQCQHTRPDDDRLDIPAKHRVERQGQQQQDRTRAGQLCQEVAESHIATRPIAEFKLQIVVGRDAVHAAVKRNEDLGGEPGSQRNRERKDEGIPVAGKGLTGQTQERNRGDEGGEDRHTHDPRRKFAFGLGKGGGSLAATEVERAAKQHNAHHKGEENQVIYPSDSHTVQ